MPRVTRGRWGLRWQIIAQGQDIREPQSSNEGSLVLQLPWGMKGGFLAGSGRRAGDETAGHWSAFFACGKISYCRSNRSS